MLLDANALSAADAQKIFGALVFCLGCCIGSFMNVVTWRLPRGEKLSYPGSHCPKCGHAIRAWENIPIISWLCLRGRCSGCGQPISVRYPIGESAVGLLYVFIYWVMINRLLPLESLPALFFLAGALLAVVWIDVQHRMIPDKITCSGIVLALILAVALPAGRHWLDAEPGLMQHTVLLGWICPMDMFSSARMLSLADALFGGAIGIAIPLAIGWCISKVSGKDAIGGGDIKLFAMLGAFFGADAIVYIMLISSLLGMIYAVLAFVFARKKNAELPFGPFISVAAFAWALFA